MKDYKYLFFGLILALVFTGCVEDDPGIIDDIGSTPNIIGFDSPSASVSAVAGGSETEFEKSVVVSIKGPRLSSISGEVTAIVSVDESSTAVEGVHYRLPANSFTIGPDDNWFSDFKITMLADGITPPLAENPVLVLNVSEVSGDGTVVATGRSLIVNMLYLCFADLSGTYTVTNDFCSPSYTATISQNADGSWYASVADGAFLNECTTNSTLENWGSFNEVCGVIQPSTDLRYGSLGIGTILGGSWDQENGILIIQNEDNSFFEVGTWESTYTRQ